MERKRLKNKKERCLLCNEVENVVHIHVLRKCDETYMWREGIRGSEVAAANAYLQHYIGVVRFRPRPLYSSEQGPRGSITQEPKWAAELWTLWIKERDLVSARKWTIP